MTLTQPEAESGQIGTDVEKRKSTLRRQVNESFCSPDGSISPSKTVAVFAQIVLLYHLGKDFDELIKQWESLAWVLTFLVAPDVVKKLLVMKYGNGHSQTGGKE